MTTHVLKPPKLRRYHILESISSKTFIPREYQVELLHTARKKNTIICLGTGTGKTFVAVMLIKEFSHQIRETPLNGGKRSVLLAPTVPLVIQQAKVIMDCTDLIVGQYFGCEPNKWTKENWNGEVEKSQVFVMTPDIFKMILHHGLLPLSLFNLIIFDECHRATKNHPYCEIMKCFDVCSVENQPRILGLSASLVNNKCQPVRIEYQIRLLESILRSSVETANDLTALSKYGSKPKELIAIYNSYSDDEPVLSNAIFLINTALVFLDSANIKYDPDDLLSHPCRQPRRYLIELSYVIRDLGLWCSLKAISLFIEEIDVSLESAYSSEHQCFLVLTRTVLLSTEVQVRSILSKHDMQTNIIDKIPPKLKTLLTLLEPYKEASISSIKETQQNNVLSTNLNSGIETQENCNVVIKGKHEIEKVHTEVILRKHSDSNMSRSEGGRIYKNDRGKRGPKYNVAADDGKALCGLIFVRQRIAAYLLSEWLSAVKDNHPNLNFLSPSYIIGHGKNISGIKSILMGLQKQEEVLQKFRTKAYNLVVATSVVEEGMDIPKCNLVIRFDPPENFRAYVQSKGRARVNDSSYILMVKSGEKQIFEDVLSDYKTVEELLLEKCHKADQDLEESVTENNIDDLVEPYMPVKEDGHARVTLSSAIALVNRYCAKLPSDTFTRLTPKWKILEENSSFQCALKLPINSPLKKCIKGPWMRSKQLSKMAVALQTCIELHKSGELDDNLMPTGKEAVKSEDFMLDDNEECLRKDELLNKKIDVLETGLNDTKDGVKTDVDSRTVARPGTTKRRMYYFKKVADALKDSLPNSSTPSYLHVFDMKLTCPIPEEQNTRGRKIHDPSNSLRTFGILTSKPIPPICSFPVFTRSGEVTVSLKPVVSGLFLMDDKLESLAFFHRYTFSDVLRLEKYPMSYKPEESEASFYVVPVTLDGAGDLVIDWKFVDLIYQQKSEKSQKLLDKSHGTFTFNVEDYQDAVVMPWYRNLDKPQFFYVAEICRNLTPQSDFPDMEYESFETYYEKKYGITIMNHDQPLLDVDHTSARLNLLTPRYVNRKGVTLPTSSEQTKRTKRENLQQKQILIPELCTVHPFPAYLWRKAVCLPCILYRLNSLLLAEQLRLLVANSISIGVKELPKDFEWPPLDFGWTLAEILTAQTEPKETKPANNYSNQVVKNGYTTSKNTQMNFVQDTNLHMNYEPETNANGAMDFEIDVFDPSKVYIPDDDALLEQELNEMNFNIGGPLFDSDNFPLSLGNNTFQSNQVSAFPIWKPKSNGGDEGSGFRCGSPSFFEESGWDSEWDTEDTDTPFLSVNVQGLGYISAPGIINMQSLSMDLASCKDDEAWDSMDDGSINSDDEEENCSTFPKPPLVFEQNSNTNSKSSRTGEEMCESSWLTCPIYTDDSSNVFLNNGVGIPDENVTTTVTELKECKKKEFSYLYSNNSSSDSEAVSLFEEMFQTAIESEKSLEPGSIITSCDAEQDASNLLVTDKNVPGGINSESTLAFGELLPNREHHLLLDNMKRVTFDENPDLSQHPGPSPSIILQALTMSNANDGINLERLETVGDSFLKYAITVYLFCMYPNIHEGKLSYLRSKQISNFNLFKLGRRKGLGELMVASKFEPYDNWLPSNYMVPKGLEEALIESGIPSGSWNLGNWSDLTQMSEEEIRKFIIEKTSGQNLEKPPCPALAGINPSSLVPYNLLTQHSIPDKSIADCVEALIGAYLVSCGSRGALLFMSWLGLRVLPSIKSADDKNLVQYGFLQPPHPPILTREPKSNLKLKKLLAGYSAFEKKIDYNFNDKSYLLQAFTHASYYYNTLTDCYQRLEFLGDAVLDYLITRHLYEDPKKHSPGTLTDLRSALVNNTFFASLAVKYDFHKFFKAISPGLFKVINKFVQLKEHNTRLEDLLEAYYLEEDECEEMEDVEVPKALGDIFESVAGAIYLDSNMSLDTVWRVYYTMMKPEIEYFSNHVPKSPIRELLELEPQTAKFERAEMTVSGKVRVCVDVFGKGQFVGVGRNKRIAKCTAAKHALRELKKNKKL